jgi:succinoglycan biosynthesis transport protein ExoP
LVAARRTGGWVPADPSWDAEPVEVSRHVSSLKRTWPVTAAIVISLTVAVFVVSTLVPDVYEARARIVMDDRPGVFAPGDAETVERRLSTVREMLLTRQVLTRAAAGIEGESPGSLEEKVRSSVDQDANFVDVRAADSTAAGAAAIANAVARSFLSIDAAAERRRLARARTQLERTLGEARGSAERRAIQEQLSELSISGAAVGSDLALAEPARPPADPSSPRPVRNSVFAFAAAVFLGVLAALGIGHLVPRVTGGRELSLLARAPIVAAVPVGRWRGVGHLASAAYGELRNSVAVQLPRDVRVVTVASALPGNATSPVAAALAGTLADGGSRALVVSADLRRPGLHQFFGVDRSPGLSDVLERIGRGGKASTGALLEETVVPSELPGGRQVDVLPAGSAVDNPAQLLASEAMTELFSGLGRSDYRYVVVEAPPLLAGVDGHLVAQHADAVLVVCTLDRLSPTDGVELGEALGRLHTDVVGLVVLDSHGRSHPLTVTPWPGERGVHVGA